MKIIEALKKIKDLKRKVEDLTVKIQNNCADLDCNEPVYGSKDKQCDQIKSWLDSVKDTIKEIEHLTILIQYTNIKTMVDISIDDRIVTKSIAKWILRRRELSNLQKRAWVGLTDRGLQPRNYKVSPDDEGVKIANVVRFYDPKKRDEIVERLNMEPSLIDSKLEVVNAVTDLIEE